MMDSQGERMLANTASIRNERRGWCFSAAVAGCSRHHGHHRVPALCLHYRYILATNHKVGFKTGNYGRRGSNDLLKTLSLLRHHNYLHSFLWI